ncbi:Uncharacterised protein [Mycobacterium tuberculosis]|nr:Uncharacterised protein [Mycobacterium tuberculosis]
MVSEAQTAHEQHLLAHRHGQVGGDLFGGVHPAGRNHAGGAFESAAAHVVNEGVHARNVGRVATLGNVGAGALHVVEQTAFNQNLQGATNRLAAHPKVLLNHAFGGQLIAGLAGNNVALLNVVDNLLILRARNRG